MPPPPNERSPSSSEKKLRSRFQSARYASLPAISKKLAIPLGQLRDSARLFPISWPCSYLSLVRHHDDPLARMGKPDPSESMPDPHDIEDPVGEGSSSPLPYVLRKHRDRVVILASARCHFYCRFCFRRDQKRVTPNSKDWALILDYLSDQKDISEVILSGGDPLTLDDLTLFSIRDALSTIPHINRWRLHTRAPATFPQRLRTELIQGLSAKIPCTMICHFNHPQELSSETHRISHLCAHFQVKLGNQAVLLNTVNDSPAIQIHLWQRLAERNIFPHYLHHPDRVAGNARFRVSIRRGMDIFDRLYSELGPDTPRYVLDLPDGSGKVPVADLFQESPGKYVYHHPDGRTSHYDDIWT